MVRRYRGTDGCSVTWAFVEETPEGTYIPDWGWIEDRVVGHKPVRAEACRDGV